MTSSDSMGGQAALHSFQFGDDTSQRPLVRWFGGRSADPVAKNVLQGLMATVRTQPWCPTITRYNFQGACQVGFTNFLKDPALIVPNLVASDNPISSFLLITIASFFSVCASVSINFSCLTSSTFPSYLSNVLILFFCSLEGRIYSDIIYWISDYFYLDFYF